MRFNRDRLLDARERFFEAQLEVITQVGATGGILAVAARVHELAENGRENVGEALETGASEWVLTAAVLKRRLAETVICGTLLRVLEYVVRFADLLEARFGFLAPVLAVGMAFLCHAAIGGLDRRLVRSAGDTQQIII